jgi:hypothetical protein
MNTIRAYMSSSGDLWLGSNTGSNIELYGRAIWIYNGGGPTSASITLPTLNSMASASLTPGSGSQGDLVIAVVSDITNSNAYRVTGQQSFASQSGNYSIIIEQL